MGRGLAALAVVVLLLGCSGAAPEAHDHGGGSPTGLTADLVQQRRDVESGAIQVELTLDADAPPVDITRVDLLTSAFPDAEPGKSLLVQPGFVVDVPTLLGDPACDTATTATDAAALPATAVLTLSTGGSAEVPLPDAHGYLARVHAAACTAARAAAVVPTRWDPTWTTTGSGADLRAVGVLHLGPVAAGSSVALEEVGSTPLFRWRVVDAGLPLTLDPGESADVAVALDPARCDAHAVADDKRGFGPELVLAVDGAEPVRVRVWVPRERRATATDALLAACAAGGGAP